KLMSAYLLLVGVLWSLAIVCVWITLGSIAQPESVFGLLFGLLIGPSFLLIGPFVGLALPHRRVGTIIASIGCAILSMYVAYAISTILHTAPLQTKPSYPVFVILAVGTLFADVAAVALWRMQKKGGQKG